MEIHRGGLATLSLGNGLRLLLLHVGLHRGFGDHEDHLVICDIGMGTKAKCPNAA